MDYLRALASYKDIVGYTQPTTSWFAVASPGRIKDEMDSVLREGQALDADIRAYSGGDANFPTFRAAWGAFWAEYKKFYDDNSGWLSRMWGSVGNKTVDYGGRLNDWRAGFVKFSGARASEPALTPLQRPEDSTAIPWKSIAIGGVVVLGLFGGGYALSKVGGVASVFKKRGG